MLAQPVQMPQPPGMQANMIVNDGNRLIWRIGGCVMQRGRRGDTNCWVDDDIPAIRQSDIDRLVRSNADKLTANRLNSVAQIAYEIDGTDRMALAANFFEL